MRQERGSAMLNAVFVMVLILSLGLAAFSYVDTQSKTSGSERTRESAFNLGEGVLNAEAFVASSNWPGTSPAAALPDCASNGASVTASSGDPSGCPSPAALNAGFSGGDYARGVSWTAKVRDNVGTDACQTGSGGATCGYFYSDATVNRATVPRYDANGDGMLWVRSRAVVGGVARTQVALVQVQRKALDIAHAVLTANTVTTKYSPKLKVYPGASNVLVRCPAAQAGNPRDCIDEKRDDQIPGDSVKTTGNAPALKPGDLETLRQRAKSEGSWFATCPDAPSGPLVFVEAGFCDESSLPATSATRPGVYVQGDGTLNIKGSGDFWGLIYLANKSNRSGNVFDSNGNHDWYGAINVDGDGNVNLGTSTNTSLTFDDNVYNGLYGYVNAGIVRPSFREIYSNEP